MKKELKTLYLYANKERSLVTAGVMQVRQLEELQRAWESKFGRRLLMAEAQLLGVGLHSARADKALGGCVSTKDELRVCLLD